MQMTGDPPVNLQSGPVHLRFEEILPGDSERGLAPSYHFKIVTAAEVVVGHINFRVGDTRHVLMTAGHIGYAVLPEHRGASYAYHACLALAPFIRSHYDRVIVTAD